MAKNQDLTLNFSKLNGVCGQLKCCLQYEDEVYREKRSRLPREGDIISTHTGEIGRVDRLHLLSEQFVMMTNRGIRKRYVVELYKDTLNKEEANFPKEFESVSDETFKVVGLDESETKKIKAFENDVKVHKAQSKNFADSIFEDLFGEKSLGYDLPELSEPEGSVKKHVANPDEEEELSYTPSSDDILDEDDDDGYSSSANDNRGSRPPQHNNQNRNQNQHRGPRQDVQGARPSQPANPNQNRGQQNNRQSEGRGPGQGGPNPGGPTPNQNQNRNQNRGPKNPPK